MIVIADTSGIVAASDPRSLDGPGCRAALDEAGTIVVSPLVIAEVDHIVKKRFGDASRRKVTDFMIEQTQRLRFLIPEVDAEVLVTARSVQQQYAHLRLDLADAVNMVFAADFKTNAVITLDRRDFRTVRPLSQHKAFRLFPDDA